MITDHKAGLLTRDSHDCQMILCEPILIAFIILSTQWRFTSRGTWLNSIISGDCSVVTMTSMGVVHHR